MKRFYTLLILLVTFATSLISADITHYGVNNEGYVETKETYSETNYKWYNVTGWIGSSPKYDITKYNTSSLGVVDNKTKITFKIIYL